MSGENQQSAKDPASSPSRNKDAKKKTLVNPVLVTVGNPALPHQTPVYAWQVANEEGKQLMRQDSPELALNFSGKNSELLQSMYDYTIVPSEKIQHRMDYFYMPYNQQFLLRKHMTFEDKKEGEDGGLAQQLKEKRSAGAKSGLSDIIERIAEQKKTLDRANRKEL